MRLEIEHSRSERPISFDFALESDEHKLPKTLRVVPTSQPGKLVTDTQIGGDTDLADDDDDDDEYLPHPALYAVRVIESNQPVGFFWADSIEQLWDMVDGVTDPGVCEHHRIEGPTALVWPGKVRWQMGVRDPAVADTDDDRPAEQRARKVSRGMTFDGSLSGEGTMSDYVDGLTDITGWTKLPYADEPGGMLFELFESRNS